MFKILDLYIGKTILKAIVMSTLLLISLSGFIKFIEQLRKIGQGEYSIIGAGLFTLLSIPKDIEIFFPMAVLLGSLLGLGSFDIKNELLIMQLYGFNHLYIANAVIKTTLPLVILTMFISELVMPKSEQIAYNYRTKMIYGSSIFSQQNKLWIRDGNNFIFIECILDINHLVGVNIFHFDQNKRLTSLWHAVTATYIDNCWKLSQLNESNLSDGNQIIGKRFVNIDWQTNLTPEKLKIILQNPNSLSISKLYSYINYLKHNGQEYNYYQLNMWNKILFPFSVIVTIFMALSCVFGPLRKVSMNIKVITGIIFGFLFYILNKLFGSLSLIYNISPIFGILLTNLIFLKFSIIILMKN